MSPAELWLRALERLTSAVAHELRNPLNGVALNLEVLRGRVSRAQTDPASLGAFADAAAADLSVAIRLSDALLAVARPVREPVEFGRSVGPIAVLAGAVAAARGGSLEMVMPDELPPALAVQPHALRAALATVLLAAAEQGSTVRCNVGYEPTAALVEVAADGSFDVPEGLVTDVTACGIAVRAWSDRLELRIPRVDGAAS